MVLVTCPRSGAAREGTARLEISERLVHCRATRRCCCGAADVHMPPRAAMGCWPCFFLPLPPVCGFEGPRSHRNGRNQNEREVLYHIYIYPTEWLIVTVQGE